MEQIQKSVSAESFSVTGSDDLILSVISDQAADIVDGWREGISNGIDSQNSTGVWLWADKERSIIHDDGDGIHLTVGKGQEFMTTMGLSDKSRDNDNTIGQFGIGKGQYIAKGQTTILSNGKALHFDIKSWGINDSVYRTTIEDAVEFIKSSGSEEWAECVEEGIEKHNSEGLTVVVNHYDSETPDADWKWDNYYSSIKDRFEYVGLVNDTDIFLNGNLITKDEIDSDTLPSKFSKKTVSLGEHGEVHLGIGHKANGSIKVYSNGLYVKDLRIRGFDGVVVTSNNLDLNFARNDIQSGCEVWSAVQEHLTDIRLDLCKKVNTEDLNAPARDFVSQQMYESDEVYQHWYSANIFKSASESMYSIKEIMESDTISFAESGDNLADRVEESLGKIVLAKNDSAVQNLKQNETYHEEELSNIAKENNLQRDKEELDFEDLTPTQKDKLGIARVLSDKLGINREIKWG